SASPCGQCDACTGIAAGQHIDVIEMDAASNTGVDDVREIIESVRYASVSARYKVYIIDEVHMLSKNAFNALLKTLEEPPPHVKFILATTEVEKVPATILSRCQRFDLKRVPLERLEAHFAAVAAAEGVAAEPEALHLVARAAEGSVRDGLSILDQAIAMGSGQVTAAAVRDMLGLAERGRTVRLLLAILEADPARALAEVAATHAAGVEPLAVLRDLLDLVHQLTLAKVGGGLDPALPEGDRVLLAPALDGLSFSALHRLWQLLLKGHGEVAAAPQPADALDMAILRLVHAAGLPGPEELAAMLEGGAAAPAPRQATGRPRTPADFEAVVRLFEANNEPLLARLLHDKVACEAFAPGAITLVATAALPRDFAASVSARLSQWTGEAWQVEIGVGRGATLQDEADARAAQARAAALADPTVRALLDAFPEGRLVAVRGHEEEEAA
ncbi:MAG: DNA polymerase III subunit gamma/tau, partial [Sphingomonadaceae bacterium]